jgi:hypothetical protein
MERQHGESKLDTRVAWEYMLLIAINFRTYIVAYITIDRRHHTQSCTCRAKLEKVWVSQSSI